MLPKGPYNAPTEEPNILKYWLENKFYKPEYHPTKGLQTTAEMKADGRKSFTIVNPPPNAYMRPHIGNVSGYAYQDVFLRYNRMIGKKVLGVPGKDHAGIQGEVVLEKIFWENKKLTKQEMGRDKFYKSAYGHFTKIMPKVMDDEMKIGLSSDFERNLFTLDPKIVETVLGTFIKMFGDKMVYKGVRIVNWDPVAQTTLADIDTEREERETELVYLKYPLEDGSGFVEVATTRAETMLGDTAVIVNPTDARYTQLVGKMIKLPLTGREIPIITSPRVDPEFGTGAVKLTPAHSYDDYVMMSEWNALQESPETATNSIGEIGYINIIGKDGKLMGPIPEGYKGLTSEEARIQVISDLENLGLVSKKEKHLHSIVIGERSKAVIEPIMSSQWFIDVEKLKQPAIDCVQKEQVKIHPQYMTKKFLHWMENLRDWPVSRSLWWGYRIPVWYKGNLQETIDENGQVTESISGINVTNIFDAVEKGLAKVQTQAPGASITVVRHGETAENVLKIYGGSTDHVLSEIGESQAVDYAASISEQYDLIITSPLLRAKKTAEIINSKLNIPVIEDSLLIERNFGELEGLTWEQFCEKYPDLASKNSPSFQPELPGGESIEAVTQRVTDFIENYRERYGDKKALIVTHAGVIRIFKRILAQESVELTRNTDIANLEAREFVIPDPAWIQDPDVFDTWFSSGQWVYATLQAHDLMDTFYPTNVMETMHDILEIWVSRMIMLSLYTQNEIPFTDVYLHGMVKAADGQKMSKSKGNVISPEEIIKEYGADSLRLLYIVGNKAGASYPVSYEKLEGYRRFLNKVWNASKFVMGFISDLPEDAIEQGELSTNPMDQKMMTNFKETAQRVTTHIEKYRLGLAAELLYQDFWHTFCDEYLEEIKPRLYTKDREGNPVNTSAEAQADRLDAQRTLNQVFKGYLTIMHPFIPFITERIWQELPKNEQESKTLMYQEWISRS